MLSRDFLFLFFELKRQTKVVQGEKKIERMPFFPPPPPFLSLFLFLLLVAMPYVFL
jgi:hypothetical protein